MIFYCVNRALSNQIKFICVLSSASTDVLFDMVASSQTINEHSRINFPVLLCLETLQTLLLSSVAIFKGSLNVECAVRPPSKSVAAMPDDATANAIFPVDLTFFKSRLIINVFPVPPGASRKNNFPSLLSIVDSNAVNTFFLIDV